VSDKAFHIFVRTHASGVAAQVIGHSYLTSFAPDLPAARADLTRVLERLLWRGEYWHEKTHYEDARLRKLDLAIRALQHGRLLEVPMRFSVLTWGAKKSERGPLEILVPRLELRGSLDHAADFEPFVEELIRHHLHMAPLSRLLEVAYAGSETLDTLVVSARAREAGKPKPRATARPGMPPGLAEACRRLNDETNILERAFQRETELARLIEIVGSRARASALLVGPTSVGKTALVHELAHRAGDLGGLEIYSTSAGRIVAGMRYLGEWQARVERMIAELRQKRAVLHFDSLGALCGLGDDDRTDVARHLLPAVEAGDVSLILEATAEDLARAERSHGAFVQALRSLVLEPLPAPAAHLALGQAAARVARARSVKIAPAALERALDLTERFGEGVLPGGAVDLVRAAATAASEELGVDHITAAFSSRTGYPRELIDPESRLDPTAVGAYFANRIVGQEQATELFTQLVVTLKTNLADPKRPLGSFLLLGPTGVGKTESALALAAYLFGDAKRLARFDMAEYAAPGSAQRLVEAGGAESSLAKRVREQPFGVVLLDEIEKADGGVHDLLLQILGEGRLTDGTARTVSFRNTIVVLTSNLGADGAGRSLGFGGAGAHEAHYRAAAAAFFRPELLNRLDQIVPYRALSPAVIAVLARRALEQALSREGLARRGARVTWTEEVVQRLAALGFDAALGARPLKRAVERHIVAPLAQLLASRSDAPPREVRIDVSDGAIIVA
jgi:ATP-dependent Clp protease ATP-binding subunit ClpC